MKRLSMILLFLIFGLLTACKGAATPQPAAEVIGKSENLIFSGV
jgi:hypothetical protein